MSMTPGPWFATKDSQFNDVARIGMAWIIGTKLPLADMGDIDDDARAISALPDLVEALKNMVENFGHGDMNDGEYAALQAARAALNKAGVTQ